MDVARPGQSQWHLGHGRYSIYRHPEANGKPIQTALSNASASFVDQETQYLALQALQASYAQLRRGKIALLPLNTAAQLQTLPSLPGFKRSGRQSRNNICGYKLVSTHPLPGRILPGQ